MAEIPAPAGEPRYFSIIIVGGMTPSLHFPNWYSSNNLLSTDEAKAGMDSQELHVTQQFASFQTAGMRITCEPTRWEIACFDDKTRSRILTIACDVFDKWLKETPVEGYGFNSFADLDTKAPLVSDALAALGVETGLGFSFRGIRKCDFSFADRELEKKKTSAAVIRSSDHRSTAVWVAFNTSYLLDRSSSVPVHFDITSHLTTGFAEHWEDAKRTAHNVVARINEITGVANASS